MYNSTLSRIFKDNTATASSHHLHIATMLLQPLTTTAVSKNQTFIWLAWNSIWAWCKQARQQVERHALHGVSARGSSSLNYKDEIVKQKYRNENFTNLWSPRSVHLMDDPNPLSSTAHTLHHSNLFIIIRRSHLTTESHPRSKQGRNAPPDLIWEEQATARKQRRPQDNQSDWTNASLLRSFNNLQFTRVRIPRHHLLHMNMQGATTPRTQKLTRSCGWRTPQPWNFSVLLCLLPSASDKWIGYPIQFRQVECSLAGAGMPGPLIGAGLSAN